MPRSIVFGNQSLLVCVDKHYNIRDIYYPHVGMENHVNGHECRIGVWVDNKYSWIESDDWKKKIKYFDDTLVGNSIFENKKLSTRIIINDLVYHKKNIFIRQLQIENISKTKREYRIFFSHDLQIYGTNIGITAYFDPETKSMIHYLKDRWFLFNGKGDNRQIDGFAAGKTHFGESLGTYKDAEDGKLSGNPIDQGTVDSTIQLNVSIEPNSIGTIEYWITVGTNYEEVKELNNLVLNLSVSRAMKETIAFDRTWANKSNFNFYDLSEKVSRLFKQSVLILKSQMDKGGAIIAANDSDIMQFNRDHYSYLWPRDGALVAAALTKAGYGFLARKFYQFCGKLITPNGYLLHKYNPDGSVGSSWHPWYNRDEGSMLAIQEDETALVLYTLWDYYNRYKDLDLATELYDIFIKPASDFLVEYRDERSLPLPSYDLWEERRGIHAFTVSSVIAGLRAAANFAGLFGDEDKETLYEKVAEEMKDAMINYLYDKELNRFLRTINFDKSGKIIKDLVIDASLYSIFEFEVFNTKDPLVESTMKQVKERLWIKTDVGGMARYENDYYHRISDDIENVPGNPWYICTLWLAKWHIQKSRETNNKNNDLEEAREILIWVTDHALESGLLAEQVNPYNNDPISVSPLTWSHATFVVTVLQYLDVISKINTCPTCSQPLPYEMYLQSKMPRSD